MAPIGMDSLVSWCSTSEAGIISIVAFLILSITLLALCTRCKNNAYNVDGMTTKGETNGSTLRAADYDIQNWKDHKNLPPNTLTRSTTTFKETTTDSSGQ